MKRLLLLGGSAQQVIAIKTAKRLGYYTILCDYLSDNPGQYYADKFYLVSTTDKEAVLEVAEAEHIDGIIGYASEPAAPTAAYVAEKLGLPGNPSESVNTLCNKDKFRAFLQEHGIDTPRSVSVSSAEEAVRCVGELKLPVIVKPVDSSGSKGVKVLKELNGLSAAVEAAMDYSRSGRVIIEEYIEKKHPYLIGGDVVVVDGEIKLWGLLNCHRDSRVNALVPVGKSYPLALENEDVERVKDTLRRMVAALGIRNCGMNIELVVDRNNRVFPIDVAARNGGNMIPDLLGIIFGVDIVEMTLRAAMGEKTSMEEPKGTGCYATHNLHSHTNGIFEDIVFSPEIEKYIIRKHIYKKEGDEVSFFDNATKALGIVFLHFDNKEQMLQTMDHANEWIRLKLK